jgi:hypothetical protein
MPLWAQLPGGSALRLALQAASVRCFRVRRVRVARVLDDSGLGQITSELFECCLTAIHTLPTLCACYRWQNIMLSKPTTCVQVRFCSTWHAMQQIHLEVLWVRTELSRFNFLDPVASLDSGIRLMWCRCFTTDRLTCACRLRPGLCVGSCVRM